jgi:hypothetical protein
MLQNRKDLWIWWRGISFWFHISDLITICARTHPFEVGAFNGDYLMLLLPFFAL